MKDDYPDTEPVLFREGKPETSELTELRELNAEMLTLLKLALPDIRLSELRMTIKNAIAKVEALK